MKLLPAGEHLISPEFPGLRLVATDLHRSWIYRYKSPVDGKMKQIKIGRWPAISLHVAVSEWEKLRQERERGGDPAEAVKEARATKRVEDLARQAKARTDAYTVMKLCDDYFDGHVQRSRVLKGVKEARRTFDTMLSQVANIPVVALTRAQAFDLIKGYADKIPVQAMNLKIELASAWDYAIDSGRIPDDTPNYWRSILRGKIKSKGRLIQGKHIGIKKRVLTDAEITTVLRFLPNYTALIEDILTMYLWTATRGAEIVAMRGEEVRKEDDGVVWWVVPKDKTKNARHEAATDLRVPLFGRALAVTMRRKSLYGDGYLYPQRGDLSKHSDQKVAGIAVWMSMPYSKTRPEYVRPRISVTHWAPHDLRRTSRTMLAALGCPNEVAEAIIGHIPPGIVATYNLHHYDAERVEWLRRLSERLESLT